MDTVKPSNNITRNCIFIGVISLTLLCNTAISAPKVTTVNIVSRGDANAKYAIAMLRLGLEKAGKPFKINLTYETLSAPKTREELLAGSIDIIWAATNLDMEENALPVRIPLFKGLLGHRIAIIHKENQHMFDDVTTFSEALKFKYGQGFGWPDTAIMEHNGMTVVPTLKYEGLFHMADGQRFDAFPRGVHEPWSEISSRPELELMVDENLMFVYTSPSYLIVSPLRSQLSRDIERGLLIAIDDGSFDELFFNNPMVKQVIKNAGLNQRRIFKLENPDLPPRTPLDNEKLWIDTSTL